MTTIATPATTMPMVEHLAKAICRERLRRGLTAALKEEEVPGFERTFEDLWHAVGEAGDVQRAGYRADAEVALAVLDALDPLLKDRIPDEPMFVLLGRDLSAPSTIEEWCRLREAEIHRGNRRDTPEEREAIVAARKLLQEFTEWRKANR